MPPHALGPRFRWDARSFALTVSKPWFDALTPAKRWGVIQQMRSELRRVGIRVASQPMRSHPRPRGAGRPAERPRTHRTRTRSKDPPEPEPPLASRARVGGST
jgi:hypothetical protein